jgi:hypothetical protein
MNEIFYHITEADDSETVYRRLTNTARPAYDHYMFYADLVYRIVDNTKHILKSGNYYDTGTTIILTDRDFQELTLLRIKATTL